MPSTFWAAQAERWMKRQSLWHTRCSVGPLRITLASLHPCRMGRLHAAHGSGCTEQCLRTPGDGGAPQLRGAQRDSAWPAPTHVQCGVVFQKWRSTAMDVTLDLVLIVSQSQEWPMTWIAVRCPHCHSEQMVKRGKTARGTQRFLCQNALCATGSFLLDYRNRGCLLEVKQQIIDMSLNASGVRDTARSLHISPPPRCCANSRRRRGCWSP
jgi:transposase-like protein